VGGPVNSPDRNEGLRASPEGSFLIPLLAIGPDDGLVRMAFFLVGICGASHAWR